MYFYLLMNKDFIFIIIIIIIITRKTLSWSLLIESQCNSP